MDTVKKINTSSDSDYSEDEIRNECVICGVDMGKRNPRQYCCKTYCPKEFEIINYDTQKETNK